MNCCLKYFLNIRQLYIKNKNCIKPFEFAIIITTLILTIIFRCSDKREEKTRFDISYEFYSPDYMQESIHKEIIDQVQYENDKILKQLQIKPNNNFIEASFLIKLTLTNGSKLPANIKNISISPITFKNNEYSLQKVPKRDSLPVIDFNQNSIIKNIAIYFNSREPKQIYVLITSPLIVKSEDPVNIIEHEKIINQTSLQFQLIFSDQDGKEHPTSTITIDKGIFEKNMFDVSTTIG